MSDCNPHPDAPHGFDRTASLNEDRYVCDCESWSEKYADRIPRESDLRTRIAAVLNDSPLLRASIPIYERNWAEQLADAVIRELGLTRRTGQGPYSNQVWYQTDWSIE